MDRESELVFSGCVVAIEEMLYCGSVKPEFIEKTKMLLDYFKSKITDQKILIEMELSKDDLE